MEYKQQTIADQVLEKIQNDNVVPISRWHFILKNSSFWTLWGLSIVIGSCATAASIFVFLHAGWQYEQITHDSFLSFLLDSIPLFWIASLALMIAFGYYNIRHTQRGYRFSFYLVVIASILASFIGGTILYTLGVASSIDNIRRPLPFGEPFLLHQETRWNNVQRGLFSGVIVSYDRDNELMYVAMPNGTTNPLSTYELTDQSRSLLSVGNHVRVIGGVDSRDKTIVACAVLPWVMPARAQLANPSMSVPINSSERKEYNTRTSLCKDIQPYRQYTETVIRN